MADTKEAPLVEARDLGKRFGSFIALHPVNMRVWPGEFFGVMGPNGAGKSTFIRLLTGQLRASIGQVDVLGIDAARDPQGLKANIGIVPESESPPSFLTSREFLVFVGTLRGVPDVEATADAWLDWFGMVEKRDTLCKDLSKGQRQKVMLASALMHRPQLLFLDEPFVNLDPVYQRKVREWLLEHVKAGGTVFMCSHILDIAERLCTRLALIDGGRVMAHGTMEELRASPDETLEDVFIRLVGASIAEREAGADEAMPDDDEADADGADSGTADDDTGAADAGEPREPGDAGTDDAEDPVDASSEPSPLLEADA